MKQLTFILTFFSLLNIGIQAETTMLVPITPALSSDGSMLVFSWEDDLWKVSTDPANVTPAQRLTMHPGREYNPFFSPDDSTIYYNSNKEGSSQVFSFNIDKASISKQITFHSVSNILEDISADGKTITYRSARDVAGRNPYRVYQSPVSADQPEKMLFDAYALNTKISPDNTKILTTREGADSYRTGYHGAQASQIWLYDIAAKTFSQPVSDMHGCLAPLWLADGSGFYYVCGKGGHFNLWKHEFSSSTDTQLTTHTDGNVMFPVISSDGSTIVYRHLFHYYRLDTEPSIKLEVQH